jgi:hypothetical protein
MSKIEINIVAASLKKHESQELTPALLREIIEELNFEAQPADEGEQAPPVKKQFVILLSSAALSSIKPTDLTGWVVQIPEDASPHSVTDRIFKGAYDFNASKRGRLLPVKTVGEAIESASAKYFRDAELWIKTKLPVAVISTDNVLPKDEFKVERVEKA